MIYAIYKEEDNNLEKLSNTTEYVALKFEGSDYVGYHHMSKIWYLICKKYDYENNKSSIEDYINNINENGGSGIIKVYGESPCSNEENDLESKGIEIINV